MGGSTWRSTQTVMIVTLHVAVVAFAIRTTVGARGRDGSLISLVILSVALAVFLSWPIGRIIAGSFRTPDGTGHRPCGHCGERDLRPLLRVGDRLFPAVVGHRCARCGTTARSVDDAIIHEPPIDPGAVGDPGIAFLSEPTSKAVADPEIRFLDDPPAGPG